MNMKINAIFLVVLLFLLAGAVSACDNNTESLKLIKHDETGLSIKLTANITFTKKADFTISAKDVKMHYKEAKTFKVTLKDSNKKLMKNTKVKILINGVTYNKLTDSKGKASVNLNLKSGTYKATTTFDGNSTHKKQSATSTIVVKSSVKADDFTKYYKNTAQYKAKFYDAKGKLLKNTTVKLKLNSKQYSVKTTKSGYAKLAIDLKPGKYNITSTNPKTGESLTKCITIKTILQTHDVSLKEGVKVNFTAKVLNSKGKASPSKKVTFTLNGNSYIVKTTKTGIAGLPIDLKKGTYTITTEYSGLKYTNKILVSNS